MNIINTIDLNFLHDDVIRIFKIKVFSFVFRELVHPCNATGEIVDEIIVVIQSYMSFIIIAFKTALVIRFVNVIAAEAEHSLCGIADKTPAFVVHIPGNTAF